MSEEPVPPPDPGTGGTAAPMGRYSVPEAARLLSISERAVRKRITAGTINAHKEGSAWVVLLPTTTGAAPPVPAALGAVPRGGTEGGTAAAPPRDPELHEAIAQLRTLLAEERQRADRYLEASTIWQGRALQLEERLKALEAGPIAGDVDQDAVVAHESGPLRGDQPDVVSEGLLGRLRRLIRR